MRNLGCATAIVLALALGGCAGGVSPTTGLPTTSGVDQAVAAIGAFTVADINNALALAKAAPNGGDAAAVMCFSYLGPAVTAAQAQLTGGTSLPVSGAFSAFEAARLAVKNGQSVAASGLPAAFAQNCGWYLTDNVNGIVQLASQLGIKIALPALPALPAGL